MTGIPSAIRATAGSIVACPNGHDLYRLTADVRAGDIIKAGTFEPILGCEPVAHAPVEPCPVCGDGWLTFSRAGFKMNWVREPITLGSND